MILKTDRPLEWASAEFRPGLRAHIRCPHRQPQETLSLPAGAFAHLWGQSPQRDVPKCWER